MSYVPVGSVLTPSASSADGFFEEVVYVASFSLISRVIFPLPGFLPYGKVTSFRKEREIPRERVRLR